jgi:CRISPR-associated protein Cas2
MTVLVIPKPRASVRGLLSRWLLELSRGVFVGRPSALVRERLWSLTVELLKNKGGCVMLWNSDREQGYSVRMHGTCTNVVDLEGMYLQKLS